LRRQTRHIGQQAMTQTHGAHVIVDTPQRLHLIRSAAQPLSASIQDAGLRAQSSQLLCAGHSDLIQHAGFLLGQLSDQLLERSAKLSTEKTQFQLENCTK
jgi:hypothetical protein